VASHACSLGHTLELGVATEPASVIITLLEHRRL